MASDDTVRAMAYQAVADLVSARTREVEDIEENIALLQGHLDTILSTFASPVFPPGFEPRIASQQNSGDALEAAENPSDVDRSLSMAGMVGCSGSPTTCIETAVDHDSSPAERLLSLPSPIHAVESLGLPLGATAPKGGCSPVNDNSGPCCVDTNAQPEARAVRQENRCENTEVSGKDRSLALKQVEVAANFVKTSRLLVNAGASVGQKASYEAGSCSLSGKLTWEELATRVTTEKPETVFDWAILGAQGVFQNSEEEKALETFFETRSKPHSKSAPQLSFSDLDNYKGMFQWLIIEEAKAVYEGGNSSISWNHPHAWSMQENLQPAGCLFRTLRVDPLQQGQSVSSNLSSYQINDVVTILSPILRQIKRVAIVDGVEEEFIRLRSRFGCDPSLNQQCVMLRMPDLTFLRRMYMAVSRASWIYRPLLQQLLRPAAPVEATSMPFGAGFEKESIPPEHRFLLSWASLKLFDGSQLRTIAALLKMQHGFLLVQGGPGTGKTTAIVGMVSALLLDEPSTKILVCATSNTAVNHIYMALMHGMVDEAGKAISPDIFHLVCARDSGNPSNGNTPDAHTQLVCLQRASVVFTTLSECGGILAPVHFDVVIVDEAHQAIEAEAIMALRAGVKRCVLVGDPHQLRSKVHQKPSTVFERSLLERLQDAGMPVHLLKAQYRMHPNIAKFPFYQFYGVSVESAKRFVDGIYTRDACDVGILSQGYRIKPSDYCFLDVDEAARCRDTRELLIIAVVEAVILSLKPGIRPHIGVITSCSEDVRATADELKQFGVSEAECEVNTVEGFQGREKDVMVLSCFSLHSGGSSYFSDDRMLNVALTRAKHSMIIVGHASSIQEKSWSWEVLLEDVKKRGGYQVLCKELKGVRPSKKNMEENVEDYKQVSDIGPREIGEKLVEIQDNLRAEEWGSGRTSVHYPTGNKNQTASLPKVSNEEGFNLEREGSPIAHGGSVREEDEAVLMGVNTQSQSQEQVNVEDQRKSGKESEMDEKATADEAGVRITKFHEHCNDGREHGYSVNKSSEDDTQKRLKYRESVEQETWNVEDQRKKGKESESDDKAIADESGGSVTKFHGHCNDGREHRDSMKKPSEDDTQKRLKYQESAEQGDRNNEGASGRGSTKRKKQTGFVTESGTNVETEKRKKKKMKEEEQQAEEVEVRKRNEDLQQPKDERKKRKKEIQEDKEDGTRSKRRKTDKDRVEEAEKTRSKKSRMKGFKMDCEDVVGKNVNAQGRGDKYSPKRRSVSPSELLFCAEKKKGKKKLSPELVDSVKVKVKKSKLSSDDAVEEKRTNKQTRKDDNVGTQVMDSVRTGSQHQVGSLVEKTRTGKQKNRANGAVDEGMVNTGKKVKKAEMVDAQELGLDAVETKARSTKSSRNKSSIHRESCRTADSADADSPNRIQDSHVGSLVKETGSKKRASKKGETLTQALADEVAPKRTPKSTPKVKPDVTPKRTPKDTHVTPKVKRSETASVDGAKTKVKKVKLAAFEKTSSKTKVKKSAADQQSSAGELDSHVGSLVKDTGTKKRSSKKGETLTQARADDVTTKVKRSKTAAVDGVKKVKKVKLAALKKASGKTKAKKLAADHAAGELEPENSPPGVKKDKPSSKTKSRKDSSDADDVRTIDAEESPTGMKREKPSSKKKSRKNCPSDDILMHDGRTDQEGALVVTERIRKRTSKKGKDEALGTLVVDGGKAAKAKKPKSSASRRLLEDAVVDEPRLKKSTRKKSTSREKHSKSTDADEDVREPVVQDVEKGAGKHKRRKADAVGEARSETRRSAVEESKPPKKKKRESEDIEPRLAGESPGKQKKCKPRITQTALQDEHDVVGKRRKRKRDTVDVDRSETGGSAVELSQPTNKKKRQRDGDSLYEGTGTTDIQRVGLNELSLELAKKAAAAAFWQSLIECKRIT